MILGRLGRFLAHQCGATSSVLLLGSSFGTTAARTESCCFSHCSAFVRPIHVVRSTANPVVARSLAAAANKNNNMSRRSAEVASRNDPPSVRHVDTEGLPDWMLPERTRILTSPSLQPNTTTTTKATGKCVLYWMQRDVRTVDNWALLYATAVAKMQQVPLRVVYTLIPPPERDHDRDSSSSLPPNVTDLHMTKRHGTFLLGGLASVHDELQQLGVPMHVLMPSSRDTVGESVCGLVDQYQPQLVVCDMTPLRPQRQWLEVQALPLLEQRGIELHQVDAHNVVPVWHASPKREVGARTLRPKIHRVVSKFATDFPDFRGNEHVVATGKDELSMPAFDKDCYEQYLQLDDTVDSVDWAQPGTTHARAQFERFVRTGLKRFDSLRNDPNHRDVCSSLSPWINYGHISFQRLALDVKKLNKYANGTAAYIEEGLVRRELSDNYVYYAPDTYDSIEAAAGWAQETLQVHASDERESVYSFEELKEGKTHDDLWNAAELQLLREGKMHGFLRMYWAKKILEWTESPVVALRTAQYLNDKYALDGNDPNGFVGVGWSIMGIHDMGWKERPVFGKIRYMNYAGCKRKFKVADFVGQYPGAGENAATASKKYGKPMASTATTKKGQKRKAPLK